jgi:alanine-synthesizing transaminase
MSLSGKKDHVKGYIEGLNMLSSMRLCSNVPSQHVIKAALSENTAADEMLLPGGRIYEQREYITDALNSIPGISTVKPKAAFYIFPRIDAEKFNIRSDEQFVLDFLHEKRILLVHGGGFNWHKPDHFRVVYLPNIEALMYAAEGLRSFLEKYRQA